MTVAGPSPTPRTGADLHPLAWWVWAGGVAVALTRVGNPLVLAGAVAAVVVTAFACRGVPAGASSGRLGSGAGAGSIFTRTLEASLILGGVIILVRTGFYILVGLPDSSPVLFDLPGASLPWFTNLNLLGPVHMGGLVHATIEGLRLAGLVVTFGAASALSNPRRALRHLPSSLHHLGTAAVIAVASAPQLVDSAARIRRAQQLRTPARGRRSRMRGWAAAFIPVLSGALDSSLTLAGSMDSRGYARATTSSRGVGGALIIALLAAAAGTYGLLDATTPPGLGLTLLLGGFALASGASVLASRSVARTRYWVNAWGWRETLLCASGVGVAVAGLAGAPGMGAWRISSPWPQLPVVGAALIVGVLLALLTRDRATHTSRGASTAGPGAPAAASAPAPSSHRSTPPRTTGRPAATRDGSAPPLEAPR